jgi:hypothetical protein
MISTLRILPVLLGLFLPAYAYGNGATASFPAGGVEFKDSTSISIQREDLYLSPREVRVDYVFHSIAEDTLTETMAFPLPRVRADIESSTTMASVRDPDGASGDMRNYLDFGVAVNGRPLIPVLHEFAWLGDKEVSAEILAAGFSLLPRYDDWVRKSQALDSETRKALIASGLLYDWESYVEPAWDYQAIYEWEQDFDPGETSVSIRYRPLMAWRGDFGDLYEVGEHAESACVDDALRRKLAETTESYGPYDASQLDYITTSARHWSGPIGQFNLTVSGGPSPPDWEGVDRKVLAAVCPADAPMDSQGNRHWSVENYVPEEDIRVFFYYFYRYE